MLFLLERLKSTSNSLLFIGTMFAILAVFLLFSGRWESVLEVGAARQTGGAKFFFIGAIVAYTVGFLCKYAVSYLEKKTQR